MSADRREDRGLELRLGSSASASERTRLLLELELGVSPPARPAPGGRANVPNPVLGGSPVLESWLSPRPVERGHRGNVAWSSDGEATFAWLARELDDDTEGVARAVFEELLEIVEERGCPHLLRVWNFLPGINLEEHGTERYRRFNAGRAAAFAERYGGCEQRFPASSAVGAPGTRLHTLFLAAAEPGRHLGNPRQVHAHRYPVRYGLRAPSFSRATVAPGALGGALFLSGTASIEGHETRHAGSLAGQLDETLLNIETLLAAGVGGRPLPDLGEFELLRVYLRDPAALEPTRRALRQRVGERVPLQFVEADICREDLMLEIEGVALP